MKLKIAPFALFFLFYFELTTLAACRQPSAFDFKTLRAKVDQCQHSCFCTGKARTEEPCKELLPYRTATQILQVVKGNKQLALVQVNHECSNEDRLNMETHHLADEAVKFALENGCASKTSIKDTKTCKATSLVIYRKDDLIASNSASYIAAQTWQDQILPNPRLPAVIVCGILLGYEPDAIRKYLIDHCEQKFDSLEQWNQILNEAAKEAAAAYAGDDL